MEKGKHYTEKVSNGKHFKLHILILIIFIIIALAVGGIVFYFSYYLKLNNTPTYVDSTIEVSKKIIGLEDIEISSMNIKSSSQASIIEISFLNTSDIKIETCEISLYLLGEDDISIFGTSIELPAMEPNSSEVFSILCSDNITNVVDYKVVLDK